MNHNYKKKAIYTHVIGAFSRHVQVYPFRPRQQGLVGKVRQNLKRSLQKVRWVRRERNNIIINFLI